MMMNNLHELLNALDEIRKREFPEIPKEIIEKVLSIEFENQDNRGVSLQKVQEIVDSYLSELVD